MSDDPNSNGAGKTEALERTTNIVAQVRDGGVGIVYGNNTVNNHFGGGGPTDDPRALADSVRRYLRPIRDEAILDEPIPRSEAEQVIEKLQHGEKSGVLVVGEAGVGKSGILAQVVNYFADAGWPIVALRLDRLEPTGDVRSLGEALRLSDSPTAALLSVAAGRPCLVVIDQLDAVSATSGRHPDFFERVADLVADVKAHPNLRLLMGCRAFDLREDHRIRRLVHAKSGIAEKVSVSKLGSDVVRQVIERAGRDPKALTPKQFQLLSLPFNLWLWTTVAEDEDEDDLDGVDTARVLLDRYWDRQSRRLDENHPRARGRILRCLDAILDYMSDARVPSVPLRTLQDEHRDALDAMRSEHVLVPDESSGTRLAFPHETIFDYLFARRFIARERDLLGLLRSREQSLFLRTTVRQVLQHMRSGDCEATTYIGTLRDLLTADDVRFHIKEAALAWLGGLDDPTESEWIILRDCIEQAPADEEWQWRRRTVSGSWFDLLWKLGYVQSELASGDAARIGRMVGRLQEVSRERAKKVCVLVATWLELGGEWPARLAQVMQSANAADTTEWVELFFKLGQRYPALIEPTFFNNRSRFFAKVPEEAPESALVVASAALESSLRRWWNDVDRSPDSFERRKPNLTLNLFGYGWEWQKIAEAIPIGFVRDILPMILETARLATRRDFIHPRKPMQVQWWWSNDTMALRLPHLDWIWLYQSVGPSYSAEQEIISAAQQALNLVRDSHPRVHERALDLLYEYRTFRTPAFLLLTALQRCGPERAECAIELLIGSPHLLNVGYIDASHWVAREVIERASLWCSPDSYRALEALLLDYTTEYERTRWSGERPTWTGPDGRIRMVPHMRALGSAQFTLLGGLPEKRRSRKAKRRLAELRRRFGRQDETGPTGIRVGTVGPPFSARWANISDEQWLRAMRRHDRSDVYGVGDDFLKGGAHQLASQLEERAKAEPSRFAKLFVSLPKDTNSVYPDAILRGLAAAANDKRPAEADTIWAVVRHGFSMADRPCGRWTWDLIIAYAKADVPDDILDVVVWYATEDPDPRPEERGYIMHPPGGGEGRYLPDSHGLNSVRGGMCWAIKALLFADPTRLGHIQPAIESLVEDQSLAVRTQVPHALMPLLSLDRDAAVDGFRRLCADDHEVVATLPIAQHFLRYAVQTHFDHLEPLFLGMLESKSDDLRRHAAQWFAAACYRGQREAGLVDNLWSAGDAPVRTGLVEVACEVAPLTAHPRHELAISVLTRAFEAQDDAVVSAATRCFWEIRRAQEKREISLMALSALFGAFIGSSAFTSNAGDLMFLLKESGMRIPDVVLQAFDRILKMDTANRYLDTALVYRLYEDAQDIETRRRCLDLIDGLLRRGDYTLQVTLAEFNAGSVS